MWVGVYQHGTSWFNNIYFGLSLWALAGPLQSIVLFWWSHSFVDLDACFVSMCWKVKLLFIFSLNVLCFFIMASTLTKTQFQFFFLYEKASFYPPSPRHIACFISITCKYVDNMEHLPLVVIHQSSPENRFSSCVLQLQWISCVWLFLKRGNPLICAPPSSLYWTACLTSAFYVGFKLVTPSDKLIDESSPPPAWAAVLKGTYVVDIAHGSQQVSEIKIMAIISSPLAVIARCPVTLLTAMLCLPSPAAAGWGEEELRLRQHQSESFWQTFI